jgi:hypothetical protein
MNVKTMGTMGNATQLIHYTIARPSRCPMGEKWSEFWNQQRSNINNLYTRIFVEQ